MTSKTGAALFGASLRLPDIVPNAPRPGAREREEQRLREEQERNAKSEDFRCEYCLHNRRGVPVRDESTGTIFCTTECRHVFRHPKQSSDYRLVVKEPPPDYEEAETMANRRQSEAVVNLAEKASQLGPVRAGSFHGMNPGMQSMADSAAMSGATSAGGSSAAISRGRSRASSMSCSRKASRNTSLSRQSSMSAGEQLYRQRTLEELDKIRGNNWMHEPATTLAVMADCTGVDLEDDFDDDDVDPLDLMEMEGSGGVAIGRDGSRIQPREHGVDSPRNNNPMNLIKSSKIHMGSTGALPLAETTTPGAAQLREEAAKKCKSRRRSSITSDDGIQYCRGDLEADDSVGGLECVEDECAEVDDGETGSEHEEVEFFYGGSVDEGMDEFGPEDSMRQVQLVRAREFILSTPLGMKIQAQDADQERIRRLQRASDRVKEVTKAVEDRRQEDIAAFYEAKRSHHIKEASKGTKIRRRISNEAIAPVSALEKHRARLNGSKKPLRERRQQPAPASGAESGSSLGAASDLDGSDIVKVTRQRHRSGTVKRGSTQLTVDVDSDATDSDASVIRARRGEILLRKNRAMSLCSDSESEYERPENGKKHVSEGEFVTQIDSLDMSADRNFLRVSLSGTNPNSPKRPSILESLDKPSSSRTTVATRSNSLAATGGISPVLSGRSSILDSPGQSRRKLNRLTIDNKHSDLHGGEASTPKQRRPRSHTLSEADSMSPSPDILSPNRDSNLTLTDLKSPLGMLPFVGKEQSSELSSSLPKTKLDAWGSPMGSPSRPSHLAPLAR